MTIEIVPVLARIIIVPTDPAFYIGMGLGVLGLQLLVWSIARDNTDIEWWRSAALAVLSVSIGWLLVRTFASADIGKATSALLGCAFAIWVICGWLYEELEIWQRVTMALGGAAIGLVAAFLGIVIRNLFIQSITG